MLKSNMYWSVEIKKRYLKHPEVSQITEFINELGVSVTQFERFYSIPEGVIRLVKSGERNLPVKLWPLIYEKIVPQYATHFMDINKMIFSNKISRTRKRTKKILKENEAHNRLNNIT